MTKNSRNLIEIANQIIERLLVLFFILFRRSNEARAEMAQVKVKAFTLAEVLITLVIIGVVSILVLPTVINKVQGYANKRAHMVFQSKIKTGIQLMTGSNALVGYQTTEQFVEQFKKYIKIAKVCDNSHLTECFNSTVTDTEGKEITIHNGWKYSNLNELQNAASDTRVNGIILQDGTNILLAYNTNCTAPENGSIGANLNCFSMIYDTNGGGKPNRLSNTATDFAVTLGDKEDNSNLNDVKDVGTINASKFGTSFIFNGTLESCVAINGIVVQNKCVSPTTTWHNFITITDANAGCKSLGLGETVPDWDSLKSLLTNMVSAGIAIPGAGVDSGHSSGGAQFWSSSRDVSNVANYITVDIYPGVVNGNKYSTPPNTTEVYLYYICSADLDS